MSTILFAGCKQSYGPGMRYTPQIWWCPTNSMHKSNNSVLVVVPNQCQSAAILFCYFFCAFWSWTEAATEVASLMSKQAGTRTSDTHSAALCSTCIHWRLQRCDLSRGNLGKGWAPLSPVSIMCTAALQLGSHAVPIAATAKHCWDCQCYTYSHPHEGLWWGRRTTIDVKHWSIWNSSLKKMLLNSFPRDNSLKNTVKKGCVSCKVFAPLHIRGDCFVSSDTWVVPSLDTFSMALVSVRSLRHMTIEVYYSTPGVISLGTGRSYLEKPSSTQHGPEA